MGLSHYIVVKVCQNKPELEVEDFMSDKKDSETLNSAV